MCLGRIGSAYDEAIVACAAALQMETVLVASVAALTRADRPYTRPDKDRRWKCLDEELVG